MCIYEIRLPVSDSDNFIITLRKVINEIKTNSALTISALTIHRRYECQHSWCRGK